MRRNTYARCFAEHAGTGKCSTRKGHARFCVKHRSQYSTGIINFNGRKIRDSKLTKHYECIAKHAGTGCCTHRRGYYKFCGKHANQFHRGIIDSNGKKLKDLKLGVIIPHCLAKHAGTGHCSRRKGNAKFCIRHASQYLRKIIDINGNKIRDFYKNGGRLIFTNCIVSGCSCSNKNRGGRFCRTHWTQYNRGIIDINGKPLRPLFNPHPAPCRVSGCEKLGGWKAGLCKKHYREIVIQEHFDRYPSIIPMSKYALEEEKVPWHKQSMKG